MIDFRKLDAMLDLDTRCLHWQAEVTPTEALEFSARSRQYNAWTPLRAVTLIEAVNKAIPPMDYGPLNPNTGRMHHTYRVGRSYSREMFVQIVKAYMPKDTDYLQLVVDLHEMGRAAAVDFQSVVEETAGSLTFRWWWD